MVGLAAFGTMTAMIASGARIAAERTLGWNRQLRITPLSTSAYFRAKVLTGYAMAAISLLALDLAGTTLGVALPAGEWVGMTALILVGLIPFAALGILLGHLLTADSIGPAIGGIDGALSILGGIWFPIPSEGALHVIAQVLPVLLARAGEPGRARGPRLGQARVGRHDRVDDHPVRAGRRRVSARHAARLIRRRSPADEQLRKLVEAHRRSTCVGVDRRVRYQRADQIETPSSLLRRRVIGDPPRSVIGDLDRKTVGLCVGSDADPVDRARMLDRVGDGFVDREDHRVARSHAQVAALEPGLERMAERCQGGKGGVDVQLEATRGTECALVVDAEPPCCRSVQLRGEPPLAGLTLGPDAPRVV